MCVEEFVKLKPPATSQLSSSLRQDLNRSAKVSLGVERGLLGQLVSLMKVFFLIHFTGCRRFVQFKRLLCNSPQLGMFDHGKVLLPQWLQYHFEITQHGVSAESHKSITPLALTTVVACVG